MMNRNRTRTTLTTPGGHCHRNSADNEPFRARANIRPPPPSSPSFRMLSESANAILSFCESEIESEGCARSPPHAGWISPVCNYAKNVWPSIIESGVCASASASASGLRPRSDNGIVPRSGRVKLRLRKFSLFPFFAPCAPPGRRRGRHK